MQPVQLIQQWILLLKSSDRAEYSRGNALDLFWQVPSTNREQGALSGIALGYGMDDPGFESRQRLEIFLFTTASRPALRSIHLPIQWVPAALSLRIKRPGRETDHSPPSSAEIKNAWCYTSPLPNTPSWRGAQLKTPYTVQISARRITG
jgi:hypothetical protein